MPTMTGANIGVNLPIPTRDTSERDLDLWNQQFRQSALYQNFMRSRGLPTDGRVRLTRSQQGELQDEMKRAGLDIFNGMHIDQGGNLNQKNRTARNIALAAAAYYGGQTAGWGSGLGGGAATGTGTAGSGASAAGGVLPSTATASGYAPYAGTATSALGGGTAAGGLGTGGAVTGGTAAAGLGSRLASWANRGGQIAGAVAPLLGSAAGAQAGERGDQNSYANSTDRFRASNYGTQQGAILDALLNRSRENLEFANTDLQRRQFALQAPAERGRQSVQGSIMANVQPVSITGLPSRITRGTVRGGLTPAVLGPETRALGRQLMGDALANQLKGDQFDPLTPTDFQGGLIPPPEPTPYQGAGTGESLLSGGASTLSILAAILNSLNQGNQPGQAGRG